MPEIGSHITQNADSNVDVGSTTQDTAAENFVHISTKSAMASASVLHNNSTAEANPGLSPVVLIQIMLAAAMLLGLFIFFLTRRARHNRDRRRDEERAANAALFGVISAPNGLGEQGTNPPPYYEALQFTHHVVGNPSLASSPDNQREKSSSKMMDECWQAVYETEDSTDSPRFQRHSIAIEQPASPRSVAHGEMRQSVSRWFRNQKWAPNQPSDAGPLSSNPPYKEGMTNLPVPPSPSYTGVPRTPSVAGSQPPTPTTATFLAPGMSQYKEPLSARSWWTGDDRLSIRASIPNSVLYPSPLQPAPRLRRRGSRENEGRPC